MAALWSSWPRGLNGKNYNVLNATVAHDHSNVNICERIELLINVLGCVCISVWSVYHRNGLISRHVSITTVTEYLAQTKFLKCLL